MKRFVSTLRPVLALLRALSLAGFLCAPSLALAVTSIDVSSVTNVYFVTYDDYFDYVSNGVALADFVISECDSVDSSIYVTKYWVRASIVNSSNAYNHIETVRNSGNVTGYDAVSLRSASQSTLAAIARSEDSIRELDAMSLSNAVMRSEATAVRSALLADVPTYEIVVYEGQGGGCSCPDYTDILNSLLSQVRSINSVVMNEIISVQKMDRNLAEIYYWIQTIMGCMDEGVTGSVDWNSQEIGYEGFLALGKVVSNAWDSVYYLDLYSGIGNGIFDVNGVRTGPRFLQEMWNYILRPIAQTLADYEWDSDNRMIHGFRDFYIGEHIVAVTNSPENPIWVQFTNAVSLSDETLAALTNTFYTLDQLMDRLTNAVFLVTWDEDTMEKQQEVEKEQTQLAANEAESQNSDPDADSVSLPSSDISGVSDISTHLSDVVNSYRTMFTAIPHELPEDILIHEGWTMRMPSLGGTRAVGDDFVVESIHWRPGDDSTLSRLLSGMRAFFVGLWLLVFIAVIWGAMSIDLFIAGVCIYCTYGLLLGKPETTLKGIRYMFRVLCSLLGRDPPK